MEKLSILEYPNDFLRKKCKPLKGLAPAKKIKQMFKKMYEEGGMGLAAPQIGWNARVFVMNITRDPEQEVVFVNPTIHYMSPEKVVLPEGCLSFPGVSIEILRSKRVIVEAYDLCGSKFYFEDDEWGSRCAQHEIDHLDGMLIIDQARTTQIP